MITDSECATIMNDFSISQVENMNSNLTGEVLIAPKGVNGSGVSQLEYDQVEEHLNGINGADAINNIGPSLSTMTFGIKTPC